MESGLGVAGFVSRYTGLDGRSGRRESAQLRRREHDPERRSIGVLHHCTTVHRRKRAIRIVAAHLIREKTRAETQNAAYEASNGREI